MLILSIIVCALESGEITNGNERREKGRGSNSSRLPSMNQQFEIFLFFRSRFLSALISRKIAYATST